MNIKTNTCSTALCILINKLWALGVLLLLGSCQTLSQNQNTLTIAFEHHFKAEDFNLYQKYVSPHGDTVLLTKLQYYISNIELKDKKGKSWKEYNSYHLIQLERQSNLVSFELDSISLEDIAEVKFAIGIDTKQNHSGKQRGVLNPSYGMFWTWSQGYIFFKAEGYYLNYPQKRKGLVYHIGHDESYRKLSLSPNTIDLQGDNKQMLIKVDLAKLFGEALPSGRSVKLDPKLNHIMGGKYTSRVADNYSRMFSIADF